MIKLREIVERKRRRPVGAITAHTIGVHKFVDRIDKFTEKKIAIWKSSLAEVVVAVVVSLSLPVLVT